MLLVLLVCTRSFLMVNDMKTIFAVLIMYLPPCTLWTAEQAKVCDIPNRPLLFLPCPAFWELYHTISVLHCDSKLHGSG